MSGTWQQKCKACAKTVYVMDQQLSLAGDTAFPKSCFRCCHCNASLQLSNFSSMEGVLYIASSIFRSSSKIKLPPPTTPFNLLQNPSRRRLLLNKLDLLANLPPCSAVHKRNVPLVANLLILLKSV